MADCVKMSTASSSEKEKGVPRSCKICNKEKAGYTCPKCNISYCSLACYKDKSHLNCSEEFYKEWVLTEMKDCKSDSKAKKEMMEILRRETEKQNTDTHLMDGMDKLDLDDESKLWSQLSDSEKRKFLSLVNENKIHQFVPIWKPWWTPANQGTKEDSSETDDTHLHPPLLTNIPSMKDLLSKSSPSPSIQFNVINVLSAYIWMSRTYNGDHQSLADDAVQFALSISRNLNSGENFENVKNAVSSVIESATKVEPELLDSSNADAILVLVDDVISMIDENRDDSTLCTFVLSALSDFYRLIKTAGRNCDSKEKKEFDKMKKKILFYLSWVLDNDLKHLIHQLKDIKST